MNYPPSVQQLLTDEAFNQYATTTSGNQNVLADLQALNASTFSTSGQSGQSGQMGQACLSGLWLLHNFLDPSHDISQDLKTPVGSHWHAIMHRLEGDFSNSKYWYGRVGPCDLYDSISQRSAQPFDPMQFVDRVQTEGNDATHDVAVIEWQVLFEHCFTNAV
jgi:hypothetical protein